jgi:macrodomain Ter protein organizer (MatP/YcbG family)
MKLSKKDKAFRTNKVCFLDFKHVEMDRVLTHLFARLKHNGASSNLTAKSMSVELFKEEFLDNKNQHYFVGFNQAPQTIEKWIETHLVDMVNRGKANEVVAAPRPLHGNTYLFRNPKYCRDYGASKHVYELLYHADNGQAALNKLKGFFFAGVDLTTGQYDNESEVDIESQALLRLSDQVKSDAPDHSDLKDRFEPLNKRAADVLAEDIIRLLTYKQYIPRSVMVEYIKTLLAFHLALYQLKLIKLLPAIAKNKGRHFEANEQQQTAVFVDVTKGLNGRCGAMAEQSATLHFKRLPAFIKSYFGVKKLDEFAEYLSKKGKLSGAKSTAKMPVEELFRLLDTPLKQERAQFFGSRNAAILDSSVSSAKDAEDIPPEIQAITKLGLSEFETYLEILLYAQGKTIRSGLVTNLDSFMLKNKPGALLAQSNGSRRFCLDGRLLEVLLQLAVLSPGGDLGFHTRELRVDELLVFLQSRYGIYIDALPATDQFCESSIDVCGALRANLVGFKQRLREIGFYKDLSDAYVTQTVSPRYVIERAQKAAVPGVES